MPCDGFSGAEHVCRDKLWTYASATETRHSRSVQYETPGVVFAMVLGNRDDHVVVAVIAWNIPPSTFAHSLHPDTFTYVRNACIYTNKCMYEHRMRETVGRNLSAVFERRICAYSGNIEDTIHVLCMCQVNTRYADWAFSAHWCWCWRSSSPRLRRRNVCETCIPSFPIRMGELYQLIAHRVCCVELMRTIYWQHRTTSLDFVQKMQNTRS